MGFWSSLFLGTEPEQRAETPSTPLIPSREVSPAGVTANEALTLGAVYRAVASRVAAISQMSIDVYRAGELVSSPSFLVTRPDIDISYRAFIEQTVVSLSLNGNAYWRIHRDPGSGSISTLEVLNPNDVTIRTTDSGRIAGFTHRGAELRKDQIKHLVKLRVPGTPYGLGPIQAARAELRGAIDLRDYASRVLLTDDRPSGILTTNTSLTDMEVKEIQSRWEESRAGRRAIAVLGGGSGYQSVYLSPVDAQFLENQRFSVTAIARLFAVPATLMLSGIDGSSMTYANVSQELAAWVKFGLSDDIAEIEQAFTDLLPRGQKARFNAEALLRLDTASRYAAHSAAIAAGWLLPSEVRDIENLPPIDGIDDRVPPSASTKNKGTE